MNNSLIEILSILYKMRKNCKDYFERESIDLEMSSIGKQITKEKNNAKVKEIIFDNSLSN